MGLKHQPWGYWKWSSWLACQVGWLDGLQNLRRLSIGDHFNQSLEGVKWPPNLEQLSFGDRFNKPLEATRTWELLFQSEMFGCFTVERPWCFVDFEPKFELPQAVAGDASGSDYHRLPSITPILTYWLHQLICPKRSRMVMGLSENRLPGYLQIIWEGPSLIFFTPLFCVRGDKRQS